MLQAVKIRVKYQNAFYYSFQDQNLSSLKSNLTK